MCTFPEYWNLASVVSLQLSFEAVLDGGFLECPLVLLVL